MMRSLVSALLLWPCVAFAGSQINVDLSESYLCTMLVTDGAVGASDGTSCNGFNSGGLLSTAASNLVRNANIPANRRLVIDSWGVVVLAALIAAEDCNLELITDNTPTGGGSVVSTLTTGPGATETECTIGSLIVDAANESCMIQNFTTTIGGGGYWRIEWEDNDGGGANTCTNWQAGTVFVRGRLVPQ